MSEAIRQFLKTAYSDEKLAALLAHAEDRKLVYTSYCCFVGVATADHALRSYVPSGGSEPHCQRAKALPFAEDAEMDYLNLESDYGESGARKKLIPMIKAEMARRASLISTQDERDTRDNNHNQGVVVYEPESVLV